MNNVARVLLTLLILAVAVGIAVGIVYLAKRPWQKKTTVGEIFEISKADQPSYIKIFTLDGSVKKENDTSAYKVTKYQHDVYLMTFEYMFKEGAKCTEVKYEDQQVWSFDKSSDSGYPESIRFNTKSKNILFLFPHVFEFYKFVNGAWEKEFTASKNKLVPLQAKELEDSEHVDFAYDRRIGTFKPKMGYAFNSVSYGKDELWSTKDHGNVAIKVLFNPISTVKGMVSVYTVDGLIHTYVVKRE